MAINFRQPPAIRFALRRLIEDAMLHIGGACGHAGVLAQFGCNDMDRRSAVDIRRQNNAALAVLNEARLMLFDAEATPTPTGAEIADVGRAMARLSDPGAEEVVYADGRWLDRQGDTGAEP